MLVERYLLADETFDKILRPVREDFRSNGITEKQLDEVVDRARRAPRRATRRSAIKAIPAGTGKTRK